MADRRQFLTAGAAMLACCANDTWAGGAGVRHVADDRTLSTRFAALEAGVEGRLGVAILDSGSQRRWGYRAAERFPMCSTFKLLAVAAVLHRVDLGVEQLQRRIVYGKDIILPHSPATGKYVGGDGLSLAQLCEAAITLSDNAAANLILNSLGGLAAFNAFVQQLGDRTTRLDRNEPTLNQALPGDLRDTTSPAAMVDDLQKLLTAGAESAKSALSDASRAQLNEWLANNKTGDRRLRAGLPPDWTVGDKTGTGAYGTTNVVGIVRRPRRAPLLVAVYLTQTAAAESSREAVLADVGRLIAHRVSAIALPPSGPVK